MNLSSIGEGLSSLIGSTGQSSGGSSGSGGGIGSLSNSGGIGNLLGSGGIGDIASAATAVPFAAVSIFASIGGGLLSIAQSLTSALTNADEGQSLSQNIMDTIGQVNSNFCTNQDTFTKSLQGVNCGVQTCNALGSQGESVLANSFNILNGNGDLVGLQLNAAKSEGESNKAQNKQIQGNGQCPGNSQNQGGEALNLGQTAPENNGEQKVYSCDWGNKAIFNDNANNKNNSLLKAIGLNTDNKKIKDELNKIQGEKKNILDKSNSDSSDNIKEELKQRVQSDNQGLAGTDAKNVEGIAKEQAYNQQIAANNQKGQNCLANASNLTKQAINKAQSASKDLLSGSELNEAAADLFDDPLKIAKAISKATKAVSKNRSASSANESANQLESNSRKQQQNALTLMKNSQGNILPQLQQSTQNRLAENKQSLDVQNTTREFIESQLNGDKEDSNSNNILNMLQDRENSLLAKNNTQNGMMNINNNKKLNSNNNSMNVTGNAMNGTGSSMNGTGSSMDFMPQKV